MFATETQHRAFEANTEMQYTDEQWVLANQRYLQARLNYVKYVLECSLAHVRGTELPPEPGEQLRQTLAEAERAMPAPSRLSRLCTVFGLSPFEQDILLLCAGIELDSEISALCATLALEMRNASTAGRDYESYEGQGVPTFGLAREAFPDAHWDAFLPVSPLRYWHLLETDNEQALMLKALWIDEYILHYLTGATYIDERLSHLFAAPLQNSEDDVVPSQRVLVDNLIVLWSSLDSSSHLPRGGEETPPHSPLVQLWGEDTAGMNTIVALACKEAGFQFRILSFTHILSLPVYDLVHIVRLWERMTALHHIVLVLDCSQVASTDIERISAFFRLSGPLVVVSRERLLLPTGARLPITYAVARPEEAELRALWQRHLPVAGPDTKEFLDRVVSQFRLNATAIRTAVAQARAAVPQARQEEFQSQLWAICRAQSHPVLSTLAQRIELHAGWSDLVLPDIQLQLLHGIVAQVRNHTQVYDTWGFAGNGRGSGLSAMFAGISGTGKTLAAEVVAHELQLDLYRIDLSSIVSKYIGETEKNLQRIFDAAEVGGVVLLFDEADALFGKRSEVKDSHDRYANIEVSYLLQRMEAYRGLAILTTNLKSSVDVAFLRRLRFVVQFPFPDATQRAEIWRRTFPPALPVSDIDVDRLARLNVAGGNIRNIALNAAFFAAEERQPLRMRHVLGAARIEYAKLEKTLTDSEIEGWV